VLLLEHNDLQICDLEISKIRSEIPGMFLNVALEIIWTIMRETKKYLRGENEDKNILRMINRKMANWFATSRVRTALQR